MDPAALRRGAHVAMTIAANMREVGRTMTKMRRPISADLLEMARLRNPDLDISIEEQIDALHPQVSDQAMVSVLVVRTARGETRTRRDPRERWSAVYRRAGLL